ncbi:M55 family metallopeptidase [Mucisphaera sp.]|uniref:M55 family metallopeptidase n=1 Tax=Mucisphaera sp. TaxID=2913024 RepID=UPI003D10F9BA
MRVLIMSDMEGVAGICTWDMVDHDGARYEEGRVLYTEEINAAVRGAADAGATEIVVVDCHGAGQDCSFNSLLAERLDPRCEYVAHHPWGRYTDMFHTGCDAALMVGMHAKAGTPDGVMCHTISTTTWDDVRFNGISVGEFGINTALCGHHDVPVVLITGDDATCLEGRQLLGDGLEAVSVKKGLSRYSARHKAPSVARDLIEIGAKRSLENLPKNLVQPWLPDGPCTITVDLSTVDTARRFMGRAGVELVGPLQVESKATDWMTAWNQIWDY